MREMLAAAPPGIRPMFLQAVEEIEKLRGALERIRDDYGGVYTRGEIDDFIREALK